MEENIQQTLFERPSLFIDSCNESCMEINLSESNIEKGVVKFRGKLQEAEAPNKNKRIYPFQVLDENVKKLSEAVKSRSLIGELDHPQDSIIHFRDSSHLITKLWWEGNTLMGEGEVLNTPFGKILKALLNDGVRVGMSSRGMGNGKVDENGVLVIGESYKLITFDAVADPSTFNAYQEKVLGYKRENVIQNNSYDYSVKNKESRIYNLSKEAFLAVMEGVVRSQTNEMKAKL